MLGSWNAPSSAPFLLSSGGDSCPGIFSVSRHASEESNPDPSSTGASAASAAVLQIRNRCRSKGRRRDARAEERCSSIGVGATSRRARRNATNRSPRRRSYGLPIRSLPGQMSEVARRLGIGRSTLYEDQGLRIRRGEPATF